MSKAIHQGTCQICGRNQKLPSGHLSKHGYTKEWGFFNGTCSGAHGLPFEQSTDLIEKAIEGVKAQIEQLQANVTKTRLSTDANDVWRHKYGTIKYDRRGRKDYYWEKDALVTEDLVINEERTIQLVRWGSDNGRLCAGAPNTIEACVAHENNGYANMLEREIADLQRYVTWQEKRVADWKPQVLIAVAL